MFMFVSVKGKKHTKKGNTFKKVQTKDKRSKPS